MMKKLLLTLLLLSGACFAGAQGVSGRFSIIPRLGGSAANTTGTKAATGRNNESVNSRYKGGFVAGFDVEYTASPQVGIALGACYATEGSRFPDMEVFGTQPKSAGYHDWHTDLHYVNVPLTANYYILPGLAVKAGIQIGFLLDAKEKFQRTEITTDQTGAKQYGDTEVHKNSLKDNFRRTDFSIPVGLSYEYMNVILDARYNFGLTEIHTGGLSDVVHSKNRFLTFTVGYRFGL